ncbi:esterase/lipase family protein [Glaciibacter flavus]|uniref:esterase/lipase family protein n=1 Tax=Orlajensenia flava TaxID=2565934 RepID=UPI003AFFF1C6
MNPLTLLVGLVRDYLFVVARQREAITTRHRPDEFASTGTERPVLIIPGIYEDWRFMRPIAVRLAEAGHPVHFVPELRRNRDPIADSAALAADIIDGLGLRDVLIVAHSKGGLIGRLVMSDTEAGQRVGGMVAVNTPFAGSRLARYALRRELREFSPRDALFARLSTVVDANERITSVFSSFDQVVPDGSLLPGAARNIRLPFIGHFRLLADVRLLAIVDEEADARLS